MTPKQQIKQEISHHTRPIKIALIMVIVAIVTWGYMWRSIYRQAKEAQRVIDPR